MMTENQPIESNDSKMTPIGKRFQAAREAMQLERKDVAAKLRLNEKIIFMMEKNRYPIDMPVIFIRGYLRLYGKLLDIPEHEIRHAVEQVKPKPTPTITPPNVKPISIESTPNKYYMHTFTALVVVTIVGLLGAWWFSHARTPATHTTLAANRVEKPPIPITPDLAPALNSTAAGDPNSSNPAVAGTKLANSSTEPPSLQPEEPTAANQVAGAQPASGNAAQQTTAKTVAMANNKSSAQASHRGVTITDDDENEDFD